MTSTFDWNVRRIAHFAVVEIASGRVPTPLVQVGFGLGCTATAMSAQWILARFESATGPYALTFLAILVATLFGRWRSGLTTLVASALLIWFVILPGGQVFGAVLSADQPRFIVDILVMLLILGFAEIFRRAICEADESLAAVDRHARALLAAEAALRQSQRMEAIGQLTGGLAHGFNNLLAGISGNLELLGRGLGEDRLADASRYIEAAKDAARRAASLTQRLLAFSRHQTLDPQPTDVAALATGMLELIRRTVGPTISVGVISPPNLWEAAVDPWMLEVNLLNLCLNARDAMTPNGGRLTIEIENVDGADFADAGDPALQNRFVAVRVSDTGVGMSAEMVARAFDPFFTTKPAGTGTGLGLSTVYGFVEQSGGRTRIESTPGKGTTIHLLLPRNERSVDAAVAPAPVAPASASRAKILVIDDEPTIRDVVVEVLRDEGYETGEASDGPTALNILRADANIDLLVVDVGLPGGMNGREVAEAARADRADLKVLFVTGYAVNVALNGEPLEANTMVITKPFAVSDVVESIGALLAA